MIHFEVSFYSFSFESQLTSESITTNKQAIYSLAIQSQLTLGSLS